MTRDLVYPAIVNVHVFRLLPPLEQAPDQIASRPLVTVSVIDVLVVNDADPVLPTVTLMPAGLDVIRWPLRPVAVTVNVALPDGGGAAACGVKRRTVENGPNAPDELRARTRHHSDCDGRPVRLTCDVVTVWFATNGAVMVDASSTCTS
jgi:hypothetical protein